MANYKRQVIIYDLIIDGNVVFTGTADEIAEKLGISPVTVYTRHRKGLHVLQEKRRELRTLTRKSREEKERRKVWAWNKHRRRGKVLEFGITQRLKLKRWMND